MNKNNSDTNIIQDNEKQFTALLSVLPDVVLIHRDGIILYANQTACSATEYSLDELLGSYVISYVVEEHRELVMQSLERRLSGEEVGDYECELRKKSGGLRTVIIRASNIVFNGEPATIVILIDITERKLAEKLLEGSKEKYRLLIHYTIDPIFSINPDETYRFVNEAFAQRVDSTPDQIIGKTPHDLYPWNDAEFRLNVIRKVFLTGEKAESEVRTTLKNGELRYYFTKVNPVKDDSGKVIWVTCNSTDITDRKKIEHALQESENHFKAMFNLAGSGIVLINADDCTIIETYNTAAGLIGLPINQIIGKECFNFICPNEKGNCPVKDLKNTVENCERVLLTAKGEHRKILKSVFAIKYKGMDCFLESFMDITEQKKNEEQLVLLNNELQRINSEKDKFFSILSHDLKSPFLGFIGLTNVLAEDAADFSLEELSSAVKSMSSSANNLYKLLMNLLEWSQMQKGTVSFNPAHLLLSEVVSQNIELLSSQYEQKEIEIINKIPTDQKVFADKEMLDSIFRNILTNSIKFSYRGGKVIVKAKEIENDFVEVSITDNGIGMSDSLVNKIFKLEEKTGRRGTENEESSGLGLLLCKEFVEKNGGKLWVESREDKGSTFYFTLR